MTRPATPPLAKSLRRPLPSRAGGFTLVEVLVSMMILAVLALTAWKGVDAITTARQVADGNLKQTLRLQAVMTQFDADMARAVNTQAIPTGALQFDGANLRLTRRTSTGVQVVVWFLRRDRLMRWASPSTTRVGDLEKYWMSSFQLRGREPGSLLTLKGVGQFQLYCFRPGGLSNCQSTGNVASTQSPNPNPTNILLPEAVRLQLSFGEASGFTGRLSRDVVVAPDNG